MNDPATVDAREEDVLAALVARLRDQLRLDDRSCFLSLTEPMPPSADFWITVAPGAARFVEGEQNVGPPSNVETTWEAEITVYTRVNLDSTGHDETVMVDATRGLLPYKRRLLRALVGHDLLLSDGSRFLRSLLYVTRCDPPRLGQSGRDEQVGLAWMALYIGVNFDPDLSSD